MFSLFNGIYDSYLAPSQLNLLVVGAPESGKTMLLERLKVTEFPTRPRNGRGDSKTVQQRIAAEELPATLRAALLETGVDMDGRSRLRSLSKTSLASGGTSSSGATPMASSALPPHAPAPIGTGNALVITKKKQFSFCPAPKRYAGSAQDQDETEHLLLGDDSNRSGSRDTIFRDDSFSSNPMRDPPRRVQSHSKEFDVANLDLVASEMDAMDLTTDTRGGNNREISMSSIGLDDDHPTSFVTNKTLQPTSSPPQPQSFSHDHDIGPPMLQSSQEEYNLRPNAKILPFRMIRPTIGTNLAKIDMYGAKCHIFDVGGRMEALWERYYDDCDAVVFCWKLGEDPDRPPIEPDSDDDDSDAEEDDNIQERIYKKQQELLDTVRKSIPDDVPFLILGHVFGKANSEIVDAMYSTDLLLPRYHNPMTGFCCSSAKTGAGVQSAMEWLIPLAKRQQKERIASKRELDMMLEEQGKTL